MTVFQKSFGCRLNQAEGQQIEAAFEAAGFERVTFGVPADVIIINSCAVTQKAETDSLKCLRHFRLTQPDACIVLTGCAAKTCGTDATDGIADIIVPHSRKEKLLATVMRHLGKKTPKATQAPGMPRTQRALLKVQDGCAFACAYCVVPFARGNVSRSRPMDECLAEARTRIEEGFQEIIVTGCNTACYDDNGHTLIDLLRKLLALPGLGRLRLSSIEPATLERDLVTLMRDNPKLCPFLHLPIQSGDDATLRRMRRRYNTATVKRFLDYAYQLMPDLSIGSDIIAGFPGETDEAYANTHALIQIYPFSSLHVFPYSERPHTPAITLPDPVPLFLRRRRTRHLISLADAQRQAYATRFIGTPVTLLVESYDPNGNACGWTAEHLPAAVSGVPPDLRRTLLTFTPTALSDGTLTGTC